MSVYVPSGSYLAMAGRLLNAVQVAPPSVVSSTSGPWLVAWDTPASQQVVADTQSIAFGVRVPPESARNAGDFSVQACPPSVDSMTSPAEPWPMPAAQHTEVDTQEIEVTSM